MLPTTAHLPSRALALVSVLALLLATFATPPAATADDDCDISWTGEESDAWDDPDNWDADGEVPGAADTVCIDVDENLPVVIGDDDDITINSLLGSVAAAALELEGGSLTLQSASSLGSDTELAIVGGTLDVQDSLTAGVLTFDSGTLTGAGTTATTTRFSSSGSTTAIVDDHDLVIETARGELSELGDRSDLQLLNGAVIRNTNTTSVGAIEVPPQLRLRGTTIRGDGQLVNEPGAVLSDQTTARSNTIAVALINRGYVRVDAPGSGRNLTLRAGGVHEGTGTTLGVRNDIDVVSSGTLQIDGFGSTFTFAPGSDTFVFGNGLLLASSGTVVIESDGFAAAFADTGNGMVAVDLNATLIVDADVELGNLRLSSGGTFGDGLSGDGDVLVRGGGFFTDRVTWRRGPVGGDAGTELRYLVDLELTSGSVGGDVRTLQPGRTVVVEADVVDGSSARSLLTIEPGALMQVAGTFTQTNVEVLVEGDLQVGAQVLGAAARLGGTGLLTGDVTSDGTVAPGASAGTLEIDGDYVQGGDGVLDIELAGTDDGEFDVLEVSGDAALDGTLEVSLLDGFVPEVGDRFVVLTAGAVSGGFSVEDLPDLGPDAEMFVLIGSDRVELVVTDGTEPDPIVEPDPEPEPDPGPEPGTDPAPEQDAPTDEPEPTTDDLDGQPITAEETPILLTGDSGETVTELAATGADARTLSGVALLALLLGAGLLLRRRPTIADDR